MNVTVLRWGFAVFWLVVAGLLFFGLQIAPEAWPDERNLVLGGVLALALAGWNIVRWYISRPRTASVSALDHRRRPLEPRPQGEQTPEYNPDFDFNRQAEQQRRD